MLISFELNVLGYIQPKYFIGGIVTGYYEPPTSFKHVQNPCKRGILPLRSDHLTDVTTPSSLPTPEPGTFDEIRIKNKCVFVLPLPEGLGRMLTPMQNSG